MARFLSGTIAIALILAANSVAARDLDKLYEKAAFKIGKQKFTAYIADDDGKREQGLMYVEKMPENVGMLFVFPEQRQLGFWMKNTLIPLHIVFLDHTGKIIDMQEMKVASTVLSPEVPTYQSKGEAQFALEMNTGWFTRHKIKMGDRLELDSTAKSVLLNRLLPMKSAKTPRH